jgi:hypothetical protein
MIQVLFPPRETIKTRLGLLGQLLARIHNDRRQTQITLGGMDQPHPQNVALVLRQKSRGHLLRRRLYDQTLRKGNRMAAHMLNNMVRAPSDLINSNDEFQSGAHVGGKDIGFKGE